MTVYLPPGQPGSIVAYRPRYEHWIGGRWTPPVRGEYFENPSPVTGEVFTEVARGTAEDIEAALDAAHAAAPAWGRTPPADRAQVLLRMADRIADHLEELAVAETWDNGKPVRETLAADLPLAVDHLRYFAGALRAQEGGLSQLDEDTVAYHFHEPLGVVGQIIPWNFPILMAVWKLAPALAAGNAVVLKPAEQTPASILLLVELTADLLPPGVLNVVNGFGLEAGRPLASSPRIRKIAFTGETTTGRLHLPVRQRQSDPGLAGARRQEPQPVLRRRRGRAGRLLRQDPGGLRDVRPQPGRGLHLPEPGADPVRRLRPPALRRPGAGAGDPPGRPAGHRDPGRRPGQRRPAEEDPLLHRDRPGRGGQGADRWRAGRPRRLAGRMATT